MGCTSKLPSRITCIVEQVEHHNLPLGIVINRCVATLKARSILVILINTNRYNVWIRQLLLAAKLFNAECDEIEYRTNMSQDDNISVGFQPVPPQMINSSSCQVEAGPFQLDSPKKAGPVPRKQDLILALDQIQILQTLILKKN